MATNKVASKRKLEKAIQHEKDNGVATLNSDNESEVGTCSFVSKYVLRQYLTCMFDEFRPPAPVPNFSRGLLYKTQFLIFSSENVLDFLFTY